MKSYYGGHPALAQVIANAYFHTQQAEGAANFDVGWNPIPDSVIGLAGAAVSVVDQIQLKLISFWFRFTVPWMSTQQASSRRSSSYHSMLLSTEKS